MNIRALIFAGAVGGIATLAACAGGGTTVVAPATPTPGPTCQPGGQAQLVYPANGSTVSVSSTNQIVVAVSTPLPANTTWNFGFSGSTWDWNNNALSANTVLQISSPPSGSGTPTFANPIYESVQLVSALPTGTTYVYLNELNDNCTPFGPVGSFTGT